jgi:hypothetical protein
MKRRFVQINGELVEVGHDYVPEPRESHHVMPDIQPYRSQIDGSMITSRSHHREHLRAHGCVEVGNDSSLSRPRPPLQAPPGLKETIARNVYEKLRY